MAGAYAYTPDIWPPLAVAIILAALGLYSGRRRDVPAALPLVVGSLFAALWLLGMALEAAAVAQATKIAWYKFQAFWRLPAITADTCFVLEYVYPGRWLTRRNLTLLALSTLLVMLLVVTNDGRMLWRSLEVGSQGRVVAYLAPAGAIALAYGFGLLLVNVAVLLWLFIRSPQHRWPAALMLFAQIAARGVYALNYAYLSLPTWFDPDVITLLLVWGTYTIALFGFRIFDPLPAARRAVIEQMHAGVVVFDAGWKVIGLNPAAEKILGVRIGSARGEPWQQLPSSVRPLPALPDATTGCAEAETEAADMTFGSGSHARHYAPALSRLEDFRGLLAGHLLILRDVTEQRRAEARLLEQQRTLAVLQERERLARELHDDLGQVLGYVKMQARAAREQLAQDHNATADEYLAQLVSVAQEAHADVREYILGAQTTAGPHRDFLPALEGYLGQFAAHYGIRTELVVGPGLSSDALEPMVQAQLLRIIQEAFTNARKHAHAGCVQVRFQREGSRARVFIEDDGAGFDAELQGMSEGGHFGLRFMQERAQEVGGSVAVVSSPGQGTQVVVEVPVGRGRGEGEKRE